MKQFALCVYHECVRQAPGRGKEHSEISSTTKQESKPFPLIVTSNLQNPKAFSGPMTLETEHLNTSETK